MYSKAAEQGGVSRSGEGGGGGSESARGDINSGSRYSLPPPVLSPRVTSAARYYIYIYIYTYIYICR